MESYPYLRGAFRAPEVFLDQACTRPAQVQAVAAMVFARSYSVSWVRGAAFILYQQRSSGSSPTRVIRPPMQLYHCSRSQVCEAYKCRGPVSDLAFRGDTDDTREDTATFEGSSPSRVSSQPGQKALCLICASIGGVSGV